MGVEYQMVARAKSGPRALALSTMCLCLAGCNHAPSQDIFGSFFPAWMLCALGGVLLTVVFRILIIKTGIDRFIPAKLIIYSGLAASLTFFLWLGWYSN